MPKIHLKSTKGHRYGGKWREPGAVYQAEGEAHARLMVALGNAKRDPAPPVDVAPDTPARGTYFRRDQIAEPPSTPARKTRTSSKAASKSSPQRRRDDSETL